MNIWLQYFITLFTSVVIGTGAFWILNLRFTLNGNNLNLIMSYCFFLSSALALYINELQREVYKK